jgi:cell division protease FtsH
MTKPYSEKTAQEIDERVHLLIEEAYKRAKQILTDNYENVEKLAKLLLEREVIFTEDVRNILGERPFPEPEAMSAPETAPAADNAPADEPETSTTTNTEA